MAAAGGNRRLTIFLVVGGVLIAMLAAYNLLGSGSGGGSDSDVSVPPPVTSESGGGVAATPSTTAAPAPEPLPTGEFDVFATRNPFEPSVQIVSETTPTESEPDAGGAQTPPASTPPATSSPEPSAGTTVVLLDVFDQAGTTMARIQVGSTQYTVAAGQTFAVSYKVVSLSGTCGQFLYGDSPFELCENEQVIK
jgi:hypothetical protein